MPSPMTTVILLTILWLVVVVPMVVRRPAGLPRARSARMAASIDRGPRTAAVRSQVPSPEEAPVPAADARDMPEPSAGRRQMMARRRRSLTILIAGSLVCVPLALLRGGITWLLVLAFLSGLAGYLYFLRGQARRDRERQAVRQDRAAARQGRRRLAPVPMPAATNAESTVRIDDDDLELHSMDTMDLSGLYDEATIVPARRRAG